MFRVFYKMELRSKIAKGKFKAFSGQFIGYKSSLPAAKQVSGKHDLKEDCAEVSAQLCCFTLKKA